MFIFKKIRLFFKSLLVKKKKNVQERTPEELFETGDVFTASNEELLNTLRELCTENAFDDIVRHKQMIRSLTINSIVNRRHIEALEKKNSLLGHASLSLTIIVLIFTVWGLFFSPEARVSQNEVDNFNRQALNFCTINPDKNYPYKIGGGEESCEKIFKLLSEY